MIRSGVRGDTIRGTMGGRSGIRGDTIRGTRVLDPGIEGVNDVIVKARTMVTNLKYYVLLDTKLICFLLF